jgi:hypothetical protein
VPAISDSFAAEFRRRLAGYGIEAVLIGALAAARYRVAPRETTDVDFLARSLRGLSEAMRGEGYSVHAMTEPGENEPYVLFIRGAEVPVDVLLAETDYQRQAMDRAVDGVITAEDVVIHKLLAWRLRDRDDIASIFARGISLDEAYIDEWVDAWDIRSRWEEAKRDLA